MSRLAWFYIVSVLFLGLVLSVVCGMQLGQAPVPWTTFGALVVLTALAQLLEITAPNRQSYYVSLVFLSAGVFLLPPALFVLLVVIPHAIEWAKARLTHSQHLRAWYIQPFNIMTHIVAGTTARLVYEALKDTSGWLIAISPVLAALAAALLYLTVNHFLVGQALVLARGVSYRDSGILDLESLLSDLALLCLGYIVAVLWQLNPWLSLPALSPLLLMYRGLMIPKLRHQAQTDEKTGLLNARHFGASFLAELERARRFGRPLGVIMADLDLLRGINNAYGHLAGDTVLAGVAKIIRNSIREYDIAGRFGGEEFSIVLPEIGLLRAREVAERIRQAIEKTPFEVATSSTPIYATMSFGVACYPDDATTTTDLIHEADIAVQQAKLKGRNTVVCAKDVPRFVRPETTETAERLRSQCPSVFEPDTEPEYEAPAPLPPEPEREPLPPLAEHVASAPILQDYPRSWLYLLTGSVILAGLMLTVMSTLLGIVPDMDTIGLLTLLVSIAELSQGPSAYNAKSISASVALNFAAGLLTGLPGVAAVSTATVLIHRLRFRPRLHQTAYNWAAHVLAGSAPVFIINTLDVPLAVHQLPRFLLPMLAGAVAYYLIETGLFALRAGLSDGTEASDVWRRQYRWLASYYVILCVMGLFVAIAQVSMGMLGILVFAMPVFMMRYVQKQYVERTERAMRELQRLNHELTLANREIVAASRTNRQRNDELFQILAKIVDARDDYMSGHAAKVGRYATALALELGLPAERVELVRQAAFLHDIGKIGISEGILHKPDLLTPHEYACVKAHTTLGADFLATCEGLRRLAPFVRYHHEWWNGQGYNGLFREQTPLESRLLAVCDAIDAMASDRPYRRARSLPEIIAEIKRCAGTQFDPEVVQAFLRLVAREGEAIFADHPIWDMGLAHAERDGSLAPEFALHLEQQPLER